MRGLILKLRQRIIVRRCRHSAAVGSYFGVDAGAAITNEGHRDAVRIGDHVYLAGHLAASSKGAISVGDYSWIGPGAIVGSAASIAIGKYVGIATGVHIIDNNNHPTEPEARKLHRMRVAPGGEGYPTPLSAWNAADAAAIVIEDNVWIGMGAFIGKGVRIGEGAIVARQSIVTHDVPPYSVVAGNPARVVKRLR